MNYEHECCHAHIRIKPFKQSFARTKKQITLKHSLSYDRASESAITPCNEIVKPLVVYVFLENVMMSISTLRIS